MKHINKLTLLTIFLLIFLFTGCKTSGIYTIHFDSNGGSLVEAITQDDNTDILEPSEPIREGYVFNGWYSDENLTTLYIFTVMPKKNITIYAEWYPILFIEGKDFYVTGNFAGWGDAPGNDLYMMTAIARNDERVKSIVDDLKGATAIYILEITLPATAAGWDVTYKIDGTVTVLDGNLTVKIIRTDADDVVPNWWAQSPESGEIMSMTPATLYIPPFVEENVDQAGGWNDNPVALAAGTYYAVYAEFGVGEAKGLGLIEV